MSKLSSNQLTPFADVLQQALDDAIINREQRDQLVALGLSKVAMDREPTPVNDTPPQGESFTLFRTFNEIFITIGIIALLAPLMTYYASFSTWSLAAGAVIAWMVAEAITRRLPGMILPHLALASFFSFGVALFTLLTYLQNFPVDGLAFNFNGFVAGSLAGVIAGGLFFWRFRLPFALSTVAVAGLVLVINLYIPETLLYGGVTERWVFGEIQNQTLSWTVLLYGLAVFLVALYLDLRDPDRKTLYSRCAFWLHLVSAPMIVHPLALELYINNQGSPILSLIAIIGVIILVGLILDRRPLLVAAFGYMGVVLSYAWELFLGTDKTPVAAVIISLGAVIIVLGFYWHPLRLALLRALPDFPGKDSLPGYQVYRDSL